MNDADAMQLVERYATSWFVDRDATGWFAQPEKIPQRACKGTNVPIARGRELVAAMLDNVGISVDDVDGTRERMGRARGDGLFDGDIFRGLGSKKTKAAWLAAVNVIRGDYTRAVSERLHWQEYAELASTGKLPTLKTGGGTELIGMLADAKTYAPDPRLPPERDDDIDESEPTTDSDTQPQEVIPF